MWLSSLKEDLIIATEMIKNKAAISTFSQRNKRVAARYCLSAFNGVIG